MRAVLVCPGMPQEKRALFHGWGSASMEANDGNMVDTVAIVELEDGSVSSYMPHYVKFLTPPPPEVAALRDQFAGQVISATLASEGRRFYQDQDTAWAYEIADAMLKAREAKP